MKKMSFLLLALALLNFACVAQSSSKKSVPVKGDFTSIGLSISAKVYLMQGENKVEAEGPDSQLDEIEYVVKNGNLQIKHKNKTMRSRNTKGVILYITMPQVEGISIAGSGDIIGKNNFVSQKNLDISIAGSGNIQLEGSGKNISVSLSGSGDVDLSGFNGQDCSVDISGSGSTMVGTVKNLSVSIAGSGKVKYRSADKVSSSVAGSGRVETM
jgi:hypothetical protein